MNEIQTLQPQPWEGTSEFTELFAPRDEEDAVPNPFAIPPAWLEAWQEDADDKAAMEAAAAEAKDVEDLKAASAAADKADAAKAHAKSASKADGIIASLSAAIPKFFQHDAEKKSSGDVVSPFIGATASGVAQAGGDIFSKASKAVGDLLGSTSQQVGAGATKGALDQLPGALTGLGTQAGGILTGLITGASQTAQAQFKPLVGAAHQAVQPAIHEVVKTTLDEAKPGITEMARSASDAATKAAQERLKAGGTGLGVDTTTLVLGGAAVLGVLGLGAYLLTSGNKFGALGALGESSTEDLQKMLDKASWSRPSGKPAVRWLSEGEHAIPKPKTESFADSGLGAGVAIVGGASALAILAGYLLKNGTFGSHKTASGAYGTGLGGAAPGGHIAHRSAWGRDRDASGPAAPALTLRSSPLHPFTLADTLGMSKEFLHLDQAAILGSSPSQKDHDDFFAGYPIGHKAGANNCDAARLGKQGVVYMKDPKKSQPWDNGWMKGYYDGWTSEGCKAGIPGLKTSSGPGGEEIEEALEIDEESPWSADADASGRRRSRGPATQGTWQYVFFLDNGTTQDLPFKVEDYPVRPGLSAVDFQDNNLVEKLGQESDSLRRPQPSPRYTACHESAAHSCIRRTHRDGVARFEDRTRSRHHLELRLHVRERLDLDRPDADAEQPSRGDRQHRARHGEGVEGREGRARSLPRQLQGRGLVGRQGRERPAAGHRHHPRPRQRSSALAGDRRCQVPRNASELRILTTRR